MDPPYASGLGTEALAALDREGWLALDVLVVLETDRREVIAPPPGFQELDRRDYGRSRFHFLRRAAA